MKKILPLIFPVLGLLAACSSGNDYDAQGTFEVDEVIVSAQTAGQILYLNVEEGDTLQALKEIGLIDTLQLYLQKLQLQQQFSSTLASRPDIARQAASLREQIAGAKVNRDRTERLLAKGAATQKQLDDYNTQVASLEGQLSGLLSQLENSTTSLTDNAAAIEAQMASVEDNLRKCHLSSPIDGVVLNKKAMAGEVAAFGTPLFKIGNLDDIYLRAYFTSDQLSGLRLGQRVKVVALYGGDNEKKYLGVISFISPTSEFTPKTIQTRNSRANLVYAVKIRVKNDGLLKIGLTGNVYVNDSIDN
ncbi:MAG: HlyD family efflux transporter periplasmic adaptor subunit [Bacteroidales bacterium]|nr:HlyD family efflux transporter periplasmic adaptor subunit [Bacteroidales bacterium]